MDVLGHEILLIKSHFTNTNNDDDGSNIRTPRSPDRMKMPISTVPPMSKSTGVECLSCNFVLSMPIAIAATTQARLGITSQNPSCRSGWLRPSQPIQRPHSTNLDLTQRITTRARFRPKIDHPFRPSRFPLPE
jgi:hypothetical protein